MKTFLYLRDDNEEEDDEIKALVDSSTDLIEVDDTLAEENYALDKGLNFFLPTYKLSKGLLGVSCV